jgi:hypothetical protein
MILFKLRCASEHEFEAWFRDNAAYDRQRSRSLIVCPDCGDIEVEKAVMAPRPLRARAEKTAPTPPPPGEMRRALQELRKHVETNCKYVGPQFAEEARRIHRGESEAQGIYGEATPSESKALADEGIEVARIPWVAPNDA